jgi:signal transduction histidine kinase
MGALEGLELVSREEPQLVLLDYLLPEMAGAAAAIGRRLPECPVIICLGRGSESLVVDLMKAGASGYHVKPFNDRELVERIERALSLGAPKLQNRLLFRERERPLEEIDPGNLEPDACLQERSEALDRANSEVVQSEKLAAFGHRSVGMAHSIRNPLNSIALFVQLLQSGVAEEERLEYLELILKEVGRIDGILGALLSATNRSRFEIGEVMIDRLLQNSLKAFAPQLEQKRIRVLCDVRRTPPVVKADPHEIEQLFTNLLLNSVQVTPQGGTLKVLLDHDDRFIYLKVSDTGPGIAPADLPYVFDPFFTTSSFQIGLGLSVVLRIVKTYHGRVEVEKSDALGTTLSVSLPFDHQGSLG